jgi:hypothetical protein
MYIPKVLPQVPLEVFNRVPLNTVLDTFPRKPIEGFDVDKGDSTQEGFNEILKGLLLPPEGYGVDRGITPQEGFSPDVLDTRQGGFTPDVNTGGAFLESPTTPPQEGGGVKYRVATEGELPSHSLSGYNKSTGEILVSEEFDSFPKEKQNKILNHEEGHAVWSKLSQEEQALFEKEVPSAFVEKANKALEEIYGKDNYEDKSYPYRSGEEYFSHVYDLVKRWKKSVDFPISKELKNLIKAKLSTPTQAKGTK